MCSATASLIKSIAILLIALYLQLPALAAGDSQARHAIDCVDRASRKILLKDIELERFNIEYRKRASVQGRWRGPRYAVSQIGNNAATMAGLFAAVAVREPARKHPLERFYKSDGTTGYRDYKIHPDDLQETFVPQMVGQLVGAYGSAVELGINKYHDRQARKLGLDHKSALAKAEAFKEEIELLFEERRKAVVQCSAHLSPAEVELLAAQEAVLADLCDLSFHEFVRFYVSTRRFRAFQDSLYVLDISKNWVGAVGNLVAIVGLDKKKPHYVGGAGVCTLISGTLIAANPLISRGVGKITGALALRKAKHLLNDDGARDVDRLEADRNRLAGLLRELGEQSDVVEQVVGIDAINHEHSRLCSKKYDLALRELRQGTRAATENVLTGAIVGGTKMTLGICAMVAGYSSFRRPLRANELLEDGSLVYGIGNAVGLADNTRIQLRNEYERFKNSRERLLPGQVLDDHLTQLDVLAEKLKQ
ncbi:MAG: hypothetical protein AB7W16_13405 [Candidatus Obscuribacterales bacterium]